MRELEAALQQFGEFLLKAQLVQPKAAPFCVRWVRHFLERPASTDPVGDQVRHFCEDLERDGRFADWQVRQAEHALRIYFVNFLERTDWQRRSESTVVDDQGRSNAATSIGSGASSPTRPSGSPPRIPAWASKTLATS